tara:strand:+ start:72 stop:710 length:639 start_codon:yes stop_codon:yes gene_type:complete
MPITFNGNGTITGISAGGLPDGIVDTDMLAANAVTSTKLASNAVTSAKLASGVGGKALQVLSVNKTDTTSYTGTNFADISGITLNITPQTNSKVLIQFCYCFGHTTNAGGCIRIARVKGGTTTYLAVADTAGFDGVNGTMVSYTGSSDPTNQIYHQSFHHLDASPSGDGSTAITYKIQWRIGSGTIYLGRDDTGSISEYAGGNEFTLTEYAS